MQFIGKLAILICFLLCDEMLVVWLSASASVLISVVAPCLAGPRPCYYWHGFKSCLHHLGIQSTTQVNSAVLWVGHNEYWRKQHHALH